MYVFSSYQDVYHLAYGARYLYTNGEILLANWHEVIIMYCITADDRNSISS